MDLQHVTTVQQRGDDTLVVYVQTEGFNPGQEVEVSVYLTQGNAYVSFNDKKRIPLPDPSDLSNSKQPAVLHVELPATDLKADQDLTVVTRVTDVWPTVLQADPKTMEKYQGIKPEYLDQAQTRISALKAVWTYQDPAGKGPGDPGSPPEGNGGSEIATSPQQ